MKAYGIHNKQSGIMTATCCDLRNGCCSCAANRKKGRVWKKRARRAGKSACTVEVGE